MTTSTPAVTAVDLFCGVGGLSYGLIQAGITVAGGIDLDPRCRYPFEQNVKAKFILQDVNTVAAHQLNDLWGTAGVRMLVGCAPCQPFSSYRRGLDTTGERNWPLLDEFSRLVRQTRPELVSMENVTRVGTSAVFRRFVRSLMGLGYSVSYASTYGPNYGLPQMRRRLVLVASLLGPIDLPARRRANAPATVRSAISGLRALESGQEDQHDPLHKSRNLSELNLRRIRASKPGGTWRDWPAELRSPCHRKATGASFANVYARMTWDEPSPTITTQSHNFGTGRFGHPEQDRPITPREAAVLQGFPVTYQFLRPDETVDFTNVGRLIGNAVPPPLGMHLGEVFLEHLITEKHLS